MIARRTRVASGWCSCRDGPVARRAIARNRPSETARFAPWRGDSMDDFDGSDHPWWEESDPERAHQKYLGVHGSDTNRSKIAITERLLGGYNFAGKSVLEYG